MNQRPLRIVSLLASATELVCDLGLGDMLVGRSHECDYPPWVKKLPAVSRPTFDITGSSRAIDERVRERLRAGLPLYEIDHELLLELEPDVLITQTHCEVCAVTPADLAHGLAPSLKREATVALRTGSLSAILEGFVDVARVVGAAAAGEALVARLRVRIDAVTAKTKTLARPTVVCLEWIDPVFAMGNWGPELVEIAGGTSLLGNAGAHSTSIEWDEVRRADPDVLVIAPCGFDLGRAEPEMHFIAERSGFRELSAVRAGRVYVADGNLYFNRSGPSLFETPEILAELLHPDAFAPHHEGVAWRRYSA